MEIKNKVSIKVKIENGDFEFLCIADASLGAIWDALTQMKTRIKEQMDAVDVVAAEVPENEAQDEPPKE